MSSCERESVSEIALVCTVDAGGAATYLVDALESHVGGCCCDQAVVGVVRVYSAAGVVVVGEVEGRWWVEMP